MSDTRVLLSRIAALKQRLEQGHGRAPAPAASATITATSGLDRVQHLETQLAVGTRHGTLLDRSFRQLEESGPPADPAALPRQMTARAHRLLVMGQELLANLRGLAGCFGTEPHATEGDAIQNLGTWPGIDAADPLAARYRDTVAMLDTALRTVQAYPDSPSIQLRLCDGLEATLGVVSQGHEYLQAAVEQRKSQALRLDRLADGLLNLSLNKPVEVGLFVELAEALLSDVEHGAPLRFLHMEPLANPRAEGALRWLARAIACHSLTVAQVVARLVRQEPDLRGQPLEPVVAALAHDVGMLRVPVEAYLQTGPLDEEQRRTLEGHTRAGAELAARLWPQAGWLAESAASHHERQDGTGYPAGLRDMQISPLVRFLAVCDVYAAWCTPRPHRPAREPRTALTDTLLLADKGSLDRNFAERLLHLSFYPVGSVVELADGAIALVTATPVDRRDLNSPARPIVALLTDGRGQWLPIPRHINLAECEGRTIVRTLLDAERRRVLGKRYPELI